MRLAARLIVSKSMWRIRDRQRQHRLAAMEDDLTAERVGAGLVGDQSRQMTTRSFFNR
jgi:hypothetical protein